MFSCVVVCIFIFLLLVIVIAGVLASRARASGQNAAGRIVEGQENAKTEGGCGA